MLEVPERPYEHRGERMRRWMNLHQGRNSWIQLAVAIAVIAFVATGWARDARAQGGKGYDTEFAFEFAQVAAKGLRPPPMWRRRARAK